MSTEIKNIHGMKWLIKEIVKSDERKLYKDH